MTRSPPGKSTTAVWGGETEHEPYERATQVPVVHSVSSAITISRSGRPLRWSE